MTRGFSGPARVHFLLDGPHQRSLSLCPALWRRGLQVSRPRPSPAHTCAVALRGGGSGSPFAQHLHVIWKLVTCGSHQAEERLNQALITVCLQGSGPE